MRKQTLLLVILIVGLGLAWFFMRQARPELAKAAPAPSPAATAPRSVPAPEPSQNSSTSGSLPPSSTPPVGVKPPDAESDKRYLDALASILQRSLVFYGRVVDERNNPVPGAKARFSLTDNPNPNSTGTRGETESDQDGRFGVTGRGMGIYVEVSKDGYYRVPELDGKRGSHGGFRNHESLGNTDVPMPTEEKPAIFVLRKMGEAVPLVHVGPRSIIVPKDGTPTEIDLGTGQVVAVNKGQLRVEVWTQNQGMNPNKGEHYDWLCRLTISGGGLIERVEQFDFEAPKSGYAATAELAQSATAERWRPNMAKQFFVRLSDNRFARINLEMIAGGDHFIVLESFLNPKPGSRNLEFDPKRVVSPSKP
jgi:hypothetical protein